MAAPDELSPTLEALLETGRMVVGTVEPDRLLRVLLDASRRLFRAVGCTIVRLERDGTHLVFSTVVGGADVEETRLEAGQGIVGWVVERGESAICNDPAADARFSSYVDNRSGFTTTSILCAPLLLDDGVVGAIEVLNTVAAGGFTVADARLLEAFAALAVAAIERANDFDRLTNVSTALRAEVEERHDFVVGTSAAMRTVVDIARKAASTPTTMLLLGESGTGKEVLARAIHQWSPRASRPFVAVNCVALTPDLLESELFGHEKGAFTSAVAQKKGKFELADGGTIFLDEIGDLAPPLQAKLLRVLQEREFQRVGGTRDLRVDVRVIAATNRDLREAIDEGRFREDLYYRLNVVSLTLPPLRERKADIPELAERFVQRYSRELGRPPATLSDGAVARLRRHDWPGNVRELQNAIERAIVLSSTAVLTERDFPVEIRGEEPHSDRLSDAGDGETLNLADAVTAFKRSRVRAALKAADGNQTHAAQLLGMRQPNLSRLIKSLDL
ncbi:MAG: sigma 54-interacting transcriptional regulator [Nitrospirota bacterium]|jgi:Nif-specific regulatory protein